jgi:hypothetical protein
MDNRMERDESTCSKSDRQQVYANASNDANKLNKGSIANARSGRNKKFKNRSLKFSVSELEPQ